MYLNQKYINIKKQEVFEFEIICYFTQYRKECLTSYRLDYSSTCKILLVTKTKTYKNIVAFCYGTFREMTAI